MKHAALLLTSILALGACSAKHDRSAIVATAIAPSDSESLLIDRNWIDRMPEKSSDHLHVFRFVPSMGGGVFQDRTVFEGKFELFVYKVDGNAINFTLPAKREKAKASYRIERIKNDEHFDLRLTLEGSPRGPSVYDSVARQHGESTESLDQLLAAELAPVTAQH